MRHVSYSRSLHLALISVHGDPLMPIGSEEAGGQNVYVRELAIALARRGHQVDVLTRGRDCTAPEVHPMEGVNVVRLPAGPAGFVPRMRLYPHLSEFVEQVLSFCREAGKAYEVIHSNYWLSGWVGMALAKMWQVPQAHTFHSLGAVKYHSIGKRPAIAGVRLQTEGELLERADRIIATSPQEAADMRHHYRREGRIQVVPCGVREQLFVRQNPVSARASLGLPQGVPLLTYVGRFDPRKGIETFVRAAALVAERIPVHLVLAGGYDPAAEDGKEFLRIQSLAQSLLPGKATFLGRVPQADLARVYSAADVVAVPSIYEPFGLVAIEAMACGTPVVGSRVGGLQYAILDGETGLLVEPGDAGALAEALARLLEDAAMSRRMGEQGADWVHGALTWGVIAKRMEAIYVNMLEAAGDNLVPLLQ